jgi:hypothetical protein
MGDRAFSQGTPNGLLEAPAPAILKVPPYLFTVGVGATVGLGLAAGVVAAGGFGVAAGWAQLASSNIVANNAPATNNQYFFLIFPSYFFLWKLFVKCNTTIYFHPMQ